MTTHETRETEINQTVDEAIVEFHLIDSPYNRLRILQGLRDAWQEDFSGGPEIALYLITIHMMIMDAMNREFETTATH